MPFLTNDPLPQCLQTSSAMAHLLAQGHRRGSRRYLSDVKCLRTGTVNSFFRSTLSGLAAAVAMTLFSTVEPAHASGNLHVYNWGEYISPEVLDRFSKEFDIKVTLDTYASNEEMLA